MSDAENILQSAVGYSPYLLFAWYFARIIQVQAYDSLNCNMESASCEEEICQWMETKIFEFIETCLQLETHPEYQKDKFVNDPVCGIRFPITQAAGKIEKNGSFI